MIEGLRMHVLVLDDDEETLGLLDGVLRRAHYEPVLATDFASARRALATHRFAAAVFDVMLGEESGLELCAALRREGMDLPVLFLSARGTVRARVDGFDAGGDDYLSKPFAIKELVARVRALTRRTGARPPRILRHAAAVLDFEMRKAWNDGTEIPVTTREWDVLRVLADARGQIVSFDDILDRVWGEITDGARASLGVIVARLRRKLGSECATSILRTVRGVGYGLTFDP